MGILGRLYIATPSTYVLTHTSPSAVGMTTRSGDSLEEFQETILAQPQLANLGIMKSPGTGSMILSMYYLFLMANNDRESEHGFPVGGYGYLQVYLTGTLSTCPIISRSLVRPFRFISACTVVLYCLAMRQRESPALTVYSM